MLYNPVMLRKYDAMVSTVDTNSKRSNKGWKSSKRKKQISVKLVSLSKNHANVLLIRRRIAVEENGEVPEKYLQSKIHEKINKDQMKTVLITGGNRGLGIEIAKQLLTKTQDVSVILTGRRGAKAREAAKNLGLLVGDRRRVIHYELDVTMRDNIEYVRDQIKNIVSPSIQVLVNNAGVLIRDKPQSDESAIRTTMNTNFFGALSMCRLFEPMLDAECSRVVNMSNRIVQLSRNPYLKALPIIEKNLEKDLFAESELQNVQWTIFNLEQLMREVTDQMVQGRLISEQYLELMPRNTHFANCSYMMSKLGVNALTKTFAAELMKQRQKRNILVNGK